jgi:hypothetical protein
MKVLIIFMIVGLVLGYLLGRAVPPDQVPSTITIVRSDDSDWVVSDRHYPDTVVFDTLLLPNEFNHLDTTYQTRYYKNISHE